MHELRRIADLAELNHLPVAFHGNGGAIATIAAAHVGVACRNFLGARISFHRNALDRRIVRRDGPLFRDGHVVLTDAPGLGLELNLEVCRRHLASGESLFD